MGIKNCMIVIVVFMLGLLPLFSSVTAEDDVAVNIHMLGETARTRFGSPVVVAGVWHYINIILEDQVSQNIVLKFYEGNSIPSIGERDESNYYEWKYDVNSLEWTDVNEYEGYSYINDTNCEKSVDTYSFCVGIKDTLPDIIDYYENWTLEIYKDTNKIYSENVVLEKPLVGFARTHADIIRFNVNPFEEMDVGGDDEFIIENVGNIPLDIAIYYETYNSQIEVTNSDEKLSPSSNFNHNITLHSSSWQPGILDISGSVSGSIPSYLIITTAVITFETNITVNAADLEVSVGHSDYKIQPIPGTYIVFQYKESLEMNEGDVKDITVYVSGAGNATLDIWSDEINVGILKITSEDQTGSPLTCTSTNTSEYAVTIRVEAIREGKIGTITYELEVDGNTEEYYTQITIGPPASSKKSEETNLPVTTIIVVICIFLVLGYMISVQIRHRRR